MKLKDFWVSKTYKERLEAEAQTRAEAIIKEKGYMSVDEIKASHMPMDEVNKIIGERDNLLKIANEFEMEITEPISSDKEVADDIL